MKPANADSVNGYMDVILSYKPLTDVGLRVDLATSRGSFLRGSLESKGLHTEPRTAELSQSL